MRSPLTLLRAPTVEHRFVTLLLALAIALGGALEVSLAQEANSAGGAAQAADVDGLARWLDHLQAIIPDDPAKYTDKTATEAATAADAVEIWGYQSSRPNVRRDVGTLLAVLQKTLQAKDRSDQLLDRVLAQRQAFATMPEGEARTAAIRAYLRTAAVLIDLSARLRYLHRDLVNLAVRETVSRPAERARLVALLTEHRSSIGAHILADELTTNRVVSRGDSDPRAAILDLVAAAGTTETLAAVAKLLENPSLPAPLVLHAAETIRTVGLPQQPRPNSDADVPAPPISPAQLLARLERMNASRLSPADASRRDELIAFTRQMATEGITGDTYRVGGMDLRAGDWLLMRNPSPYNLFTDLSPGLFTHVGVLTIEKGPDGIRRMVVVDLPEKGQRMPASNVETFLYRTLHYVFVRDEDAAVAQQMADAARAVIGNETLFDLTFRTSRVLPLAHKPLEGEKIHTYCAGLLLLCALQTDVARGEYFPIGERVAGGNTAANVAVIGLSAGDDLISPTGAFFSPRLSLVARREPMYDPGREIEEAVYDHFATCLEQKKLVPSQDWMQAVRQQLADAARTNPQLAKALADAANVNPELDLAAAARAAAVVETLDEIAHRASDEFEAARAALTSSSVPQNSRARSASGRSNSLRPATAATYQRRHQDLYQRWRGGQLTPRQLRKALVDFHIAAGQRALDERFFPADKQQE